MFETKPSQACTLALLPTCFVTSPLSFRHRSRSCAASFSRPLAPHRRKTARVSLSLHDTSQSNDDITCGDAIREWIVARDKGELAKDSPDARSSCAPGRVGVLFVGQDNTTLSATAEAIFTDLCERRALDCFSCHSVGISAREGEPPDKNFVEALRFKRGLDMSRKMACLFHKHDLDSYNLVVCMDEHTRSELLYMGADHEGRFNDSEEEKVVVLSTYCSNPRLQSIQLKSCPCSRDEMNFLISAMIDACNGLLMSLIESPPMPTQ